MWGDAGFVPVYHISTPENEAAGTDANTANAVGLAPDWGGYGPRLQFGAYGSDPNEQYGFNLEIHADWWWGSSDGVSTGIVPGENANVWIKPFDFLTLKVGRYNEDPLRGKISPISFPDLVAYERDANPDWRPGVPFLLSKGEDAIFTRFQANRGAHLALEFGDLYVGASVGDSGSGWASEEGLADGWSQIQVGVGYTIENVGLARAQFVGGTKKWDDDTKTAIDKAESGLTTLEAYNRIEVAFALTSLPVGTIDIGAKIPLSYDSAEKTTVQAPFSASVGGNLLLGPIDLVARLDMDFLGSTKVDGTTTEDGLVLVIAAEPSYKIGDSGITVGADVQFKLEGDSKTGDTENKDGKNSLGLGLWVGKAIGAANIRAGVLAGIPAGHNWDGDETRSTRIAIPIQFSFSL
jgi:hypothetical protein